MAVDRATGDLSAYPDLVMILLGMRVNTATGVKTLLGFGPRIAKVAKMSRMVFCLTKPSCGHCSRRTPASVSTGGTSRHWRLGLAQNPIGRGGRVSFIASTGHSGTQTPQSMHSSGDSDSGEWQDRLVDESPDQETMLAVRDEFDNRRKALSDALGVLNGRDRRIFEGRRLAEDPLTLAELADEFGVSRERARQIEVRAFEKVQKAVKNRVAAIQTPIHQPMH